MSELGKVLSKLAQVKRITNGALGAKPPAAWRFVVIFGKKTYFNAVGSHFARVQNHLKELDFESKLKKLNCSIFLLLAI